MYFSKLFPFLIFLIAKSIILVNCNTFIWDPTNSENIDLIPSFNNPNNNNKHHLTFSNPPRCIRIPSNLTLCYGIKYNEMRLPNLLYHETLNEIIEQSNSWIHLIKIGCHPDTQLFLCSLFSPVCLDQTIPPCRSLCEQVKKNCEPSMLRHGFSWPPMMQCNLFPIENNMCIESQIGSSSGEPGSSSGSSGPSLPQPPIQQENNPTNSDLENSEFHQRLMESICNSDWVIKMGWNQLRNNNQIRVKKFKLIFGNLNLNPPFTLTINKSMIINDSASPTASRSGSSSSSNNNKPREKFIIIGKGQDSAEKLSIKLIINWLKNLNQIKKSIKKAKTTVGCKKFLQISSQTQTSSSSLSSSSTVLSSSNGPKRPRNNRNRKKNPNLTKIQ